jgi:predicted metal-dependent peptidase
MIDLSDDIARAIEMDRFLGAILLSLVVVEKKFPPGAYGGLSTDGIHLFIDPEMWEEHPLELRLFALLHEAGHVASLHPLRMKDLPEKVMVDEKGRPLITMAQAAVDLAVNESLFHANIEVPKGSLIDEKHRALSAEDYYKELEKKTPKWKGPGYPSCGGVESPPPGTEHKVVSAVQMARAACRGNRHFGSEAGNFEEELEKILALPPRWLGRLRRWMKGFTREVSWNALNRKLPPGIFLPGRKKPGYKCLAFLLDTSGSVPLEDIQRHLSSIRGCLSSTYELIVIQHDVPVTRVDKVRGAWPEIRVVGRGGTSFVAALKKAEEFRPDAIIALTDGAGAFPPKAPKIPLLWVLTVDCMMPFGDSIVIDEGK